MQKENLDISYYMIITIVFLTTLSVTIILQEKAFAQNATTPLSISYQSVVRLAHFVALLNQTK